MNPTGRGEYSGRLAVSVSTRAMHGIVVRGHFVGHCDDAPREWRGCSPRESCEKASHKRDSGGLLRRRASARPGGYRFHRYERSVPSIHDLAAGLPGGNLGLYFERWNSRLRRLWGSRSLVREGHADGGLARPGPMPRDRTRRIPDQTRPLGAVHQRPPAPSGLTARPRAGSGTARRADPPSKTPTGTGRLGCGRLVSRRPYCPNIGLVSRTPPGTPRG